LKLFSVPFGGGFCPCLRRQPRASVWIRIQRCSSAAAHQQGSAKGYNPKRPGRKTHHPLLAVLGEARCVLHAWLRSGNTSASRGVSDFLSEALALVPAHWKIRCVRADSGFFARELFEFLEQRAIPYVVVARLTSSLKRLAAGIRDWKAVDEDYATGEFFAQIQG